jgi:hypothetical protein
MTSSSRGLVRKTKPEGEGSGAPSDGVRDWACALPNVTLCTPNSATHTTARNETMADKGCEQETGLGSTAMGQGLNTQEVRAIRRLQAL